jgi:hypothetical protein
MEQCCLWGEIMSSSIPLQSYFDASGLSEL